MHYGNSRTSSIRCIGKRRSNIVFGKFGEITDDSVFAHPGSKHLQYIGDSDAHPADCRLPAALSRLNRYDAFVFLFHNGILPYLRKMQHIWTCVCASKYFITQSQRYILCTISSHSYSPCSHLSSSRIDNRM